MRRELRWALKSELERQIREKLPRFRPARLPQLPDFIVFCWTLAPELTVFVSFQISQKHDSFTTECAWSTKGRFPASMTQMFPRDIPESGIRHDDPIDGEFRFRLGELFAPRQDFWWHLSPQLTIEDVLRQQQHVIRTGNLEEEFPIEQAIARVPEAVNDALDRIVRHALPYFGEVARSHGLAIL